MKWKAAVAALPMFVGLVFLAGEAAAAPCSAIDINAINSSYDELVEDGSPGDVSTDDMTFRGNDADACSALYNGNESEEEIDALGWGDFVLGPKSDTGGAPDTEDGFTVSFAGDGTWTLSYDSTGTFDIVGVLKQANYWAAFRFDAETFPDGTSGTWVVEWCSNNGLPGCSGSTLDDLSHLSIFYRVVENGGGGELLPEPGSLLLMGFGLAGLTLLHRRRRRA